MFPTWLIWSIKLRNQGAIYGNVSKNRIMKLDESLQHSKVHSRARRVYGNIKADVCRSTVVSVCSLRISQMCGLMPLWVAPVSWLLITPKQYLYIGNEKIRIKKYYRLFCGIHPVVVYHVNIEINITVNQNKFLSVLSIDPAYSCRVFSKSWILMPEGSPHDRKIQHLLTKLMQFVVADGDTYVNSPPSCGA